MINNIFLKQKFSDQFSGYNLSYKASVPWIIIMMSNQIIIIKGGLEMNYVVRYTKYMLVIYLSISDVDYNNQSQYKGKGEYHFVRMSKKNQKKQQNLFHLFIQSADKLPNESSIFPQFEYMDQSIRKSYNQLKKIKEPKKNKLKYLNYFQQFWQQLDNDDKVNVYCNWTKLINVSLELEKNINLKLQSQSINMQDEINIKKFILFNNGKWQKKNVKLTPIHVIITKKNKKQKWYLLQDYQITKQKSSHNFSWALHPINKNSKHLQFGVPSQTMFDEWFSAMKININNQRIQYFCETIKQERIAPGIIDKKQQQSKIIKVGEIKKQKYNKPEEIKTLTEIMIAQQMKMKENDVFSDFSDKEEFFDIDECQNNEKDQQNTNTKQKQKKNQIESNPNPNIFQRLIPQYNSLTNFADTPINSTLLHCQSDYRIYQLPFREGEQISLKFFTVLPYPKTLIFLVIASESMTWNDDIDLFTVKTKISSENTVLIYEKNKPQGILYRQRDFLYLRHSFSAQNYKQKNSFFIDKSIDSIHHPPFMTVVRAQRQLIWGLIQKQSGKQCILIVEGWIKGGGYMSQIQNKQMTLKYMKKLSNLNGYIKQIQFQQKNKANLLFKQDWIVDISTQKEPQQKNQSNISEQKSQKSVEEQEIQNAERERKRQEKQQQLMAEFVMRTNEQLRISSSFKAQILISDEKLIPQNYIPPKFTPQKYVIIPQQYLKVIHSLEAREKPKKSKLFPHFRGHHLWKGEWQIIPNGGLAYVDQQKMQEQKKVLIYIIKKIGKNIFSGKGILNISLPVDIFCLQSNIERLAMSFGYFPYYLEKAADIKQPEIQLKYVIGGVLSSSLIYLTMQKPFNPILGETYQCQIDNCPIYFEQISHHPPIAAFMMKGRGYTVSGCVEAKMDLSINSGTGNNEGIFKIQFDNGNSYYCTTPAGCLTGLTYGDRKLILVGKAFYWTDKGLFLQIVYNPAAKTKGFFGGGAKGQGDEKLVDYFQGYVKQYPPQTIKQICNKKCEGREIPIIPKGGPNTEASKTFYKVYGRWNKYIMCGQQKIFDVDQNRYYAQTQEKNPLPSHSNYRQDIVYRRLKNFVTSQDFKQILQIRQREDRKLRLKFSKGSKKH